MTRGKICVAISAAKHRRAAFSSNIICATWKEARTCAHKPIRPFDIDDVAFILGASRRSTEQLWAAAKRHRSNKATRYAKSDIFCGVRQPVAREEIDVSRVERQPWRRLSLGGDNVVGHVEHFFKAFGSRLAKAARGETQ